MSLEGVGGREGVELLVVSRMPKVGADSGGYPRDLEDKSDSTSKSHFHQKTIENTPLAIILVVESMESVLSFTILYHPGR